MIRRILIAAAVAAIAIPSVASAQLREMPSAERIIKQLERSPRMQVAPQRRVTIEQFKRRPELRRAAPSIDIQSINFAFGSAEIPYSQYGKVEQIARAMQAMISRRGGVRFLLEGHTDAVGSDYSNLLLSQQRAASLAYVLVSEFGVPRRVIETVGYGEEDLLVPTPYENWQNRRVTLRRVDQFIR
jgi:outer membrane protein OmpA-like peptidoglycan-associated protein